MYHYTNSKNYLKISNSSLNFHVYWDTLYIVYWNTLYIVYWNTLYIVYWDTLYVVYWDTLYIVYWDTMYFQSFTITTWFISATIINQSTFGIDQMELYGPLFSSSKCRLFVFAFFSRAMNLNQLSIKSLFTNF